MKKLFIRILAYILPILVLVFYFFMNPAQKGSIAINCMVKKFTGLSCSGCGAQRALYNLLHGNFIEALQNNFVFILAIPFLFGLYFELVETYLLGRKNYIGFYFSNKTGLIVLIIVVVFTIVRNLPGIKEYISV